MKTAAVTVLFLVLPVFSLSLSARAEQEGLCITQDLQLKVADAFLEEGEYYRAITEYKRFLILFPDSGRASYALFRIGAAYYRGEEYEQAARALASLREKHPESPHLPNATYLEGLSHWKAKDYAGAVTTLGIIVEDYPQSRFAPLALAVQAVVWLDAEDPRAGIAPLDRFMSAYPEHPAADNIREARALMDRYEDLPRKSPALAGILSAVLPGSGYFYAGHFSDGLSAFFLNALFIAGTVTALHNENYALGVLAGGVGLPFYLGNIYGSANAAKKWNLAQRKELRDRIYSVLKFAF